MLSMVVRLEATSVGRTDRMTNRYTNMALAYLRKCKPRRDDGPCLFMFTFELRLFYIRLVFQLALTLPIFVGFIVLHLHVIDAQNLVLFPRSLVVLDLELFIWVRRVRILDVAVSQWVIKDYCVGASFRSDGALQFGEENLKPANRLGV